MAPLSRALSGVILPHDHFGTHLNNAGKTIDKELEIKNFGYAGQVAAEIWGNMIIDKHLVVAEYVPPDCTPASRDFEDVTAAWYQKHVRESQYFLQVCSF